MDEREEVVYTMSELQTILKIGKNTAYKLVKLKGFPSIQIGKKILISKNELNEWLKNNKNSKIVL